MGLLVLLCILAAVILFGLAGFNVPTTRVNLFYLGWAALALALLLSRWPS